jgi:uncharacterized protein (TIGR02599 family)
MKTRNYQAVQNRGFTLVEVMVSTALVVAIMALLLTTVDQTQRIWQRARGKTTQFQAARSAFDIMARRLSQSTLNTYWISREALGFAKKGDFTYRRQAELQFICGPMERFLGAAPAMAHLNEPVAENYPTHGIFFSAPIGYTEYEVTDAQGAPVRKYRSLDSMLTACGYFIEFGPEPELPIFFSQMNPPYPQKLRYRLMEMTVPSERFNIFARPKDDQRHYSDPRAFDENENFYEGLVDKDRRPIAAFVRPLWMKEALKRVETSSAGTSVATHKFAYARPMADNVLALIILPKLAEKDRVIPGSKPPVPDPEALELAPYYEFDSWRVLAGKTETHPFTKVALDNRNRDNIQPPIVQLTMLAIDEPSAVRMNLGMTEKPDWTRRLFRRVEKEQDYLKDMSDFEDAMNADPKFRPNYRVFTTDVVIRGSKWSRELSN